MDTNNKEFLHFLRSCFFKNTIIILTKTPGKNSRKHKHIFRMNRLCSNEREVHQHFCPFPLITRKALGQNVLLLFMDSEGIQTLFPLYLLFIFLFSVPFIPYNQFIYFSFFSLGMCFISLTLSFFIHGDSFLFLVPHFYSFGVCS